MKTIPCDKCEGTGRLLDQREVGKELRALRIAAKISLRNMAESLGLSAPYVSDLELGRRNWSRTKIKDYTRMVARKGVL